MPKLDQLPGKTLKMQAKQQLRSHIKNRKFFKEKTINSNNIHPGDLRRLPDDYDISKYGGVFNGKP